ENNFIENAKDPLGTFYTEDMGFWDVSGNIWAETVTWCTEDDEHHPAGPDPTSTTSINIPYNYSPDNAACVPQIVAKTAGAGKNLAKSDGVCDLTAIRRGSMDPKGTRSDFPGFTPVYDLLGRTVCSRRPGLIVTTRGLVVVDEAVTNRGQ
ncbi:MAG: hypothetical protein JXA18_15430, partial [Chitinispirillaceae bacterium]|nr:hypothetical protein [Chitinispirillaceae bacterium]